MPIVLGVNAPVIYRRCRVLYLLCFSWQIVILAGCFSERSYPVVAHDIVRFQPPEAARVSARAWIVDAHAELQHLLPRERHTALLTAALSNGDGQPTRVLDHFKLRFDDLDTLLGNLDGLMHTAHLASAQLTFGELPAWPEFEDVWIPITPDLELAGRLGLVTDESGQPVQADCIVVLPGLLGDNGVMRTRDLSIALRDDGFHVLALELRACGQTEARYPGVPNAWGVYETQDLLLVSEWLERRPEVQRTGLIGFCWGGNIALLTAWADCRPTNDPSVAPELAEYAQEVSERRHYTAGVLAFSPVLRFEDLIDQLDRPRSPLFEPVLAAFQDTLRLRQQVKEHPAVTGSLRDLIRQEIDNWGFTITDAMQHGLTYLRLLPYGSKPAGDKLECAGVPVLIVQAANDPLVPAQDLADLITRTSNPNVAALILRGGGHVGFAAYSRAYYFSLIFNFFDAQAGPRAVRSE